MEYFVLSMIYTEKIKNEDDDKKEMLISIVLNISEHAFLMHTHTYI